MVKIEIIELAKEILNQFEEEYVWFPLRYEIIKVKYEKKEFWFTKEGFELIEDGIQTTLEEMDDLDRTICLRLIPEFTKKIKEKEKDGK